MAFFAVFLFSASALSYEVLLSRFFVAAQHHHLLFIVIGIALLGAGASGTALHLSGRLLQGARDEPAFRSRLPVLALACAVSAPGAYVAVGFLPLDFFRLAIEPPQILFLAASFTLFALPFFFTGLATGMAYAAFPKNAGKISFAALTGSLAGVLVSIAALPLCGLGNSFLLAAFLPLGLLFFKNPGKKAAIRIFACLLVPAAILLFHFAGERFREAQPSSYKGESELLARAGSRLVAGEHSLEGRVFVVESPSLRVAPGLSLNFSGELPQQKAVFTDAGSLTVLYGDGGESGYPFVRKTIAWVGVLAAAGRESALVIQRDGGSAAALALCAGMRRVTLVDDNATRSRLFREHYRDPDLTIVNENPRAFLAADAARHDLLIVDHEGAALPGLESLLEDYLLTVEVFRDYYRSLADGGVLVVSRKLILPPAGLMRLAATAQSALALENVPAPETHLFLLRGLQTVTLFVAQRPLGATQIALIRDFAERMQFDLVWYPGMGEDEANRFYVFPEPWFYRAVHAVLEPGAAGAQGLETLPFSVDPVTDDRPYFSLFVRWDRIGEYQAMTGGRTYALFVTGETVVAAALLLSLVFSAALVVFPLAARHVRRSPKTGLTLTVCLLLGALYMWVELNFISLGTLCFANSTISFVVVLVTLFLSSGLGGLVAQKLSARLLPAVCLACAALLFVIAPLGPAIVARGLGLPALARLALFVLLLFPAGLCIGIPFPLLMRTVFAEPSRRAFAWAANGCGSVVGTVLETLAALAFGFRAVFFLTAALYALCAGTLFLLLKRKAAGERANMD